jgi:hypothetical protein
MTTIYRGHPHKCAKLLFKFEAIHFFAFSPNRFSALAGSSDSIMFAISVASVSGMPAFTRYSISDSVFFSPIDRTIFEPCPPATAVVTLP